jgi:hypothetical protein
VTTIDPNQPIQPSPDVKKSSSKASAAPEKAFDDVFRTALHGKPEKPSKTESAASFSEIRPVQFAPENKPPQPLAADQAEKLLDAVEAFQQKLMDKNAGLKDIDPLVQKIRARSESLAAVSQAIGEREDLAGIVNQSLMLASKEIARFGSGYYNDK